MSDHVIERIRKLMRLAKSPNEHEAIAAATKAQELLAAYNLDVAEIGDVTHENMFEIGDSYVTDSRPWRRFIAPNLAVLYFCDYFWSFDYEPKATRKYPLRYDQHKFVGQRHNVIVAKEMFAYLCDAVQRLTDDAKREASGRVHKRAMASYVNAFRNACAERVGQRLYAKYLEQSARPPDDAPTALGKDKLPVLHEKTREAIASFMRDNVTDLSVHESRAVSNSALGVAEGRAAGETVSLETQVAHDKAQHALESPR